MKKIDVEFNNSSVHSLLISRTDALIGTTITGLRAKEAFRTLYIGSELASHIFSNFSYWNVSYHSIYSHLKLKRKTINSIVQNATTS